jgi:predicted alpha/beta hydrolase
MRHARSSITPLVEPHPMLVTAADGYPLGATVYSPAGRARGTVLIHGATAVPASYYARYAAYLADLGLRVVTYDYRGVGRSRPTRLRGFRARMTDWAALDARAMHDFVRDRFYEPLAVIGHSFGGQLLGLIDEPREASGVLLVGAQQGYVGHWPAAQQARMQLIWRGVLPAITATAGYLPGWAGLGVDLPAGVARQWARWCTHPGYYAIDHADAPLRLARFDRPVLMYSFSDDDYAPPRAIAALADKLSGTLVDHRALTPLDVGGPVGHFGFFRPAWESSLWRESAEWLLAALADEPLPSRRHAAFISAEDIAADLAAGR